MIVATPKRPLEEYGLAVEFAGKLPEGTSLATGAVGAVVHSTGADATSTVLQSNVATISGTQAIFRGKAGTSPIDYLITVTVTLNDGQILVEEVLLQVRLALTLVATPAASNANSYCLRSEADAYHQTHLYNAVWLAADDWKKEAALIWATRLLDEQVDWRGYVTTVPQSLRWPRSMVIDRDRQQYFDNTTIPIFLKNATAELARHLLIGDRTQERSYGLASVKADTVDVVFDKHDVKPILPPSVRSIVEPYGMVNGPGSGIAKLVRA